MARRSGWGLGAVVLAVLRHPVLWLAAGRQALRLVPRGWWRRPPFLPLPSRPYVRFRATTQYGDPDHALVPDDVVQYLAWCRSLRSLP
jgi:hypothetical protein